MPSHVRRAAAAAVMVLIPLVASSALTPLAGWSGTAGATGTGPAAGAGAAGSTWAGYFFPLKVGWTCHETLTGSGATGSETLTVAAVGRVPQGRSVTVTEGSSSTADGTSVPTNAALHYVLNDKGQLISVPSGLQVGGQPYSISGDTTYPSVRTLLSGGSAVSRLHIAAPLSAADRAELQAVLPANATALDMAVDLAQRGGELGTLQTSLGTFHHVLTVHSMVQAIAFTNVNKAASKQLAAAIKPILAKELSVMTWYAPGVGPIKTSTDGFTSTITSCGPAAG